MPHNINGIVTTNLSGVIAQMKSSRTKLKKPNTKGTKNKMITKLGVI